MSVAAALLLAGGLPLAPSIKNPLVDPVAQEAQQGLRYEPHLVQEAARLGIWPGMAPGEPGESHQSFTRRTQASYAISNAANPYFLRGDFDSDGIADLAILVRERSTNRTGLAVVPGTLEKVHLFGFAPDSPGSEAGWRVVELGITTGGVGEGVVVGLRDGSGVEIRWAGGAYRTSALEKTRGERTEPELVRRAREHDLWPEGIRYEILWERNPAYIRGDFNGDGELDVAVLVRDTSNRNRGIVIVPSTLDRLHVLLGRMEGGGITDARKIFVIPKGEVLRPFPGDAGPREPIQLQVDAIWAGVPGAPYTGAWYWAGGEFRWVTLSD